VPPFVAIVQGRCKAGTLCPLGTVTPLPCPKGHYCPDGQASWHCPAGTFGTSLILSIYVYIYIESSISELHMHAELVSAHKKMLCSKLTVAWM
jgi:hypothetical protein